MHAHHQTHRTAIEVKHKRESTHKKSNRTKLSWRRHRWVAFIFVVSSVIKKNKNIVTKPRSRIAKQNSAEQPKPEYILTTRRKRGKTRPDKQRVFIRAIYLLVTKAQWAEKIGVFGPLFVLIALTHHRTSTRLSIYLFALSKQPTNKTKKKKNNKQLSREEFFCFKNGIRTENKDRTEHWSRASVCQLVCECVYMREFVTLCRMCMCAEWFFSLSPKLVKAKRRFLPNASKANEIARTEQYRIEQESQQDEREKKF